MRKTGQKDIKVKVIANPSAGDKNSHEEFPNIRTKLEQKFKNIEFSLTNGPGDAIRLAKTAVEHGFHRIITIGGDGTVNEVVNGISGKGTIIGIIPTGTNNDFYKSISRDNSIGNSLKIITDGIIQLVDTCRIDGHYFINHVSFGVFTARDGRTKNNEESTGLWSQIRALYTSISKYGFSEICLKIDNVTVKGNFAQIVIGNGCYSENGLKWTPHSIMADGLIDICLLKKDNKLKLINSYRKARYGRHTGNSNVLLYRCRQVAIELNEKLPIVYDGEVLETHDSTIEIKSNPKSLKILMERDNKTPIK
ncbi:MAG: YegS/Rv2252/BmrU family lipid kinase [candidate division Zixibacteria bacterium]|nr:YegS/Rv2252/BmrU family lipid kinase [candidate division Zixibacteria bacterium]